MKRVVSIIILVILILGLFPALGWNNSVNAESNSSSSTVDVIIQTDGGKQAVARSIKKLGGRINYSYQNVPVLAATIPVEVLPSVYHLPGVIKVAKDRLVYLGDGSDLDGKTRPTNFTVKDTSGVIVKSIDPAIFESTTSPQGYGDFLFSGADQIWGDTTFGKGSVVAVVDSGTVPNLCLAHAVTGAPGYPDGYNATGDGIPATDPENFWHGTHVGGVLASYCILDFTGKPDDLLYRAISTYLPWDDGTVPIFGQAPLTQIYPVKVFSTDGSGSPTSVILDGLDHLLTLKRENLLDVDVVNLSFGGPTWFDGRDILDTFLEKFREENILVVAAAGNGGPLPNSLASPATSFDSIAVGALDYADPSRIVYEYLGLINDFGPGQGMVMRPTEEVRVANFSSRGPMSDGRFGPDLSTSGMWSFQSGPKNELRWDSGTSFSAPVVAGTAALLNAYYEAENDRDTPWVDLRNSLLLSANRDIVGASWQDINTVGYGALDAVAALEILISGDTQLKYPVKTAKLRTNILGNPMSADRQEFKSGAVSLNPSESYDLVFDIVSSTSKVTIEVYDITTPDNSAYAYWPNSLKVQVQSAKRSDFPLPINTYWDPYISGSEFTVEIEDGTWAMNDNPLAYQPMEPGLMKVSLIGDYANESQVSFKMRVIRENETKPVHEIPFAKSIFNMGDEFNLPVEIPHGVSKATFDLVWNRDWGKFPTSDIDMLVYDPDGNLVSLDGATGNTPERAVITDPVPGIWTIRIEAIEVYKTDLFRLNLKTEYRNSASNSKKMISHLVPPFDIITQHPVIESILGTADDTATTYIIWLPIIP
ncbi:MAG: S8 family serine peptidase [Chloroflexi bacterium]|nr:S8 family serine peptidase [Chloroflexota bacterium]